MSLNGFFVVLLQLCRKTFITTLEYASDCAWCMVALAQNVLHQFFIKNLQMLNENMNLHSD